LDRHRFNAVQIYSGRDRLRDLEVPDHQAEMAPPMETVVEDWVMDALPEDVRYLGYHSCAGAPPAWRGTTTRGTTWCGPRHPAFLHGNCHATTADHQRNQPG
jgi:hypothetical protein